MTDDSGVESKNNAMTLWINTCCLRDYEEKSVNMIFYDKNER